MWNTLTIISRADLNNVSPIAKIRSLKAKVESSQIASDQESQKHVKDIQ